MEFLFDPFGRPSAGIPPRHHSRFDLSFPSLEVSIFSDPKHAISYAKVLSPRLGWSLGCPSLLVKNERIPHRRYKRAFAHLIHRYWNRDLRYLWPTNRRLWINRDEYSR
jgi:hypothetical protein